jgi:hypothetical protein
MEETHPERIIAARNGAPLLLGIGKNSNYVVSDASALLQVTRDIIYLEEGDVAELRNNDYRIVNCLHNQLGRRLIALFIRVICPMKRLAWVPTRILFRKRFLSSRVPWRIRWKWYQYAIHLP